MPKTTNSKAAIVDAAAELIRSRGVQGTSIADIVAASGTSAGAIYHHFPNKNAVVVEVARTTLLWPLTALEKYRSKPASPAKLLGFALDALTYAPELGQLLIALGSGASVDSDLGRQLRAEFALLKNSVDTTMEAWAIANEVPIERVHGYSQLMMGLTLGYGTQQTLVENFDADDYRAKAIGILEVAN